ncbi:integrin alpha-9-like [Amphibalanus amphitrite]|uniref:integrin alpha-9-like n=1 Tax=Amphibalanus amphitrite TaxID=1232801 RepID=UPI001C90A5E1|nr:integrin alpha-9-like [Amphibalanus amphitrite]
MAFPRVVRAAPVPVPVLELVLLLMVSPLTTGFNVDTAHPVIFRGPVTDPTGRQTRADTYFGYSVSLAGVGMGDGPWLLAGAPRANSTLGLNPPSRVLEPGAVFKCPLRRGAACQEVLVDPTGNDVNRQRLYTDLKDQGWLGGAMDAEPGGTGRLAVSGFRWRNRHYSNQYLGNGVCYLADALVGDNTFQKFVPLYETTKQSFQLPDTYKYRHVYYYSYGQAGTSVHFPDNGRELILGAPGVFDWTGTLIRYSAFEETEEGGGRQRRRRQANDLSELIIPNPFVTEQFNRYDYLGYSVGSGRFFSSTKSTVYVAGAPRAADGKGSVLLFDFPRNVYEPYEIMMTWEGSTVGEYFGAAVLAVDLNGDGLSDVVVGAPLFGEGSAFEHGRIYVYINSDRAQFKSARTTVGRGALRARFGSTLASLGDIDNDSFFDFAVGAPYEEDGRGAVYVFRGGPGDFVTTASQRIAASELNADLRGFGISLSRGVDVDGNRYPDVAVGSYASGDAVLLRTRPVLQFAATLSAQPEKLEADTREFEVQACLTFHGQYVPPIVAVNVTLKVESFHAQSVLVVDGQDESSTSQRWKVTKDNQKCQQYTVAIRMEGSLIDFNKPIQLSMSNTYVIGSTKTLDLELKLTNGGEPASLPSLTCVRMTCQLVAFPDTATRATVQLSMRLDVGALRPLLDGRSAAALVTHGFVHIRNSAGIAPEVNRRPDRAAVSTELLPSALEPQPLAVWIIVLAVLGALLLLAVIVFVMHRAGFFERTKRDQLLEEKVVEEFKRLSTVVE